MDFSTDGMSPDRASNRATFSTFAGAAMAEPTSAAAILAKLMPAAVGALIMIAVDTPQTKREWFLRILVAFLCSWAFYGVTFDGLHSVPWFSFLDKTNEDHQFAVRAMLGSTGWFVMGATAMLLKKLRNDPVGTIAEVKKDLVP